MDATRCPRCNERMKVVATSDGRTGFQCLQCEMADAFRTNAMADNPLTTPNQHEVSLGCDKHL
jgi:tRNA(Ile2) C34 agmatinyltransferase TiaS